MNNSDGILAKLDRISEDMDQSDTEQIPAAPRWYEHARAPFAARDLNAPRVTGGDGRAGSANHCESLSSFYDAYLSHIRCR